MSSPAPPPSGSPPPPPPGPPPPSPPGPPPPPSSASTGSVSSANYFFGFVITFVVLLLIFVGCGIGSWHRFRLIGTAWDGRLQVMEGSTPVVGGRKRGRRRRLVRPVFWESWTSSTPACVAPEKWQSVQPVSVAFVWPRTKRKPGPQSSATEATMTTPQRSQGDRSVRGVGAMLRTFVLPRRPRLESTPKPPVERLAPEAVQVVVLISMPCAPSPHPTTTVASPSSTSNRPRCVGHASERDYEIGVVQIPWPALNGDR